MGQGVIFPSTNLLLLLANIGMSKNLSCKIPVSIIIIAGIINVTDVVIICLLTRFDKLNPTTEPNGNPIQRYDQNLTTSQLPSAIFIPISVDAPVKCVEHLIAVKLVPAF